MVQFHRKIIKMQQFLHGKTTISKKINLLIMQVYIEFDGQNIIAFLIIIINDK